jgi:ribonuclease P protein component
MVNRSMRMTASWEIARTRSKGASAASGPMVARILPNDLNPPRNRYTVIAGKRIGKAHERNRCKRLTREAIRLIDPELAQGNDIVLSMRGGIQEMTGLDVAMRSLREIARKARILAEVPK